jgi:hypothetical protein
MTVAPPPASLSFDAEDFAAYQGTRQSSNIYNRRRQEVSQKLEELGRRLAALPAGAELARAGLERGLSDPHPSLRNQHRVTAQWLYFLRPESERALLEAHLGRQQSIAALVEDPSPIHRHLAVTLRVDATGLSAQIELYPSASVDRRNWLAGASAPDGAGDLAGLLAALASGGFRLVAGDGAPAAPDVAALVASLAAERPARLEIGLPLPDGGDPTPAAADALLALCPLYRFAAWREENDRLDLRATMAEAGEAARALAERVGAEEQERARIRREQQETARQRALRGGSARSVLDPHRRDREGGPRDDRPGDHAPDDRRPDDRRPNDRPPAETGAASPPVDGQRADLSPGAAGAAHPTPSTPRVESLPRADSAPRGDGAPRGPAHRPSDRAARGPDRRSDRRPTGRPGDGRSASADRPDLRRPPPTGPAGDGGAPGPRRDDRGPRRDDRGPRRDDRGPRRDEHAASGAGPARDRSARPDHRPPKRQLPDATAPVVPVGAGDEVAIVAGLFNGKVAVVLGTAADGTVELTVGRLRMTLPPDQVRKIN